MVAWVLWIRGRLDPLEAEARALAAARERGDADLAVRQAAFQAKAQLLQDSIAGAGEWDRALRAYEAWSWAAT